jgi:hypothetical protein
VKPTIFISYSHEDKIWKDQLFKHLEALEVEMTVETWSDEHIAIGDTWLDEIEAAIDRSHIAILLVSVDFLNSRFIRDTEIPRLLERRSTNGMRIYPIVVRACTWPRIGWLGSLQIKLFGGKPLAALRGNNLETALADVAVEIWAELEKEDPENSLEHFIITYRECLSSKWARWDLSSVGVTQSGGTGTPIEATLDDMYMPLRLGKGFDINSVDHGYHLSPPGVLDLQYPLVVRGPAGAGKTTWTRWTFRQLLQREDAFPLMLVLRDLARRWQDPGCIGPQRSLDIFLDDGITELLGVRFQGELRKLLHSQKGPRPVLFVDGWDETGRLGEELREKLLVFMRQHPRIRVVVTSRPYGESRPSNGDGFQLLDIQPLSNQDIETFSNRFFARCYGDDHDASRREAERFQRALERSPEPQALARTALLLTMMLLISRSRPLPDKRHLLYEACIENLLTALPQRKEEEGALLQWEQYRPADSETRMRVVARFAFRLQKSGYKENNRSQIVRRWREMAQLLPEEWPERERLGFLSWLAGPAGLLTDRTDGTLAFTHLSFQEFLAAWYLNAEIEGSEARYRVFREHLGNWTWWETLRLWAALIERQSPHKLDTVFEMLNRQGEDGLSFAGTLLADGHGEERRFDLWIHSLLSTLSSGWSYDLESCARAWAASRQEARKESLARAFAAWAPSQRWLGWHYGQEFSGEALGLVLPDPQNLLARAIVVDLKGETSKEASTVAAGRILSGGPAIWPSDPSSIGLLHAWPGQRRLFGLRLQLAASCGAQHNDLLALARSLLKNPLSGSERDSLARIFACVLGSSFNNQDDYCFFARDFARDFARYFVQYFTHESIPNFAHYFAKSFARSFAGSHRVVGRKFANRFSRDFSQNFTQDFDSDISLYRLRGFPRSFAKDLGYAWGIENSNSWFEGFAAVEFSSLGRPSARSILAHGAFIGTDEAYLLYEACSLSLHPDRDPYLLKKVLNEYSTHLDPLWPALARHLARRSTAGDRILLTDLACNHAHREPPLSWGLQFIVRGDIMLDDHSITTLDQLTEEAGFPPLPYLEELPEELDIDWW